MPGEESPRPEGRSWAEPGSHMWGTSADLGVRGGLREGAAVLVQEAEGGGAHGGGGLETPAQDLGLTDAL